jgi:hypothetical protein
MREAKGITIYLYSLDFQLVDTFTSAKMAAKQFSCDKDTILKYARSGNIFKSQNILSLGPLESGLIPIKENFQYRGHTIYVYSLDNRLLNTFTTATEAAVFFKSTRHTILKYAKSQDIFRGEYVLSLKELFS